MAYCMLALGSIASDVGVDDSALARLAGHRVAVLHADDTSIPLGLVVHEPELVDPILASVMPEHPEMRSVVEAKPRASSRLRAAAPWGPRRKRRRQGREPRTEKCSPVHGGYSHQSSTRRGNVARSRCFRRLRIGQASTTMAPRHHKGGDMMKPRLLCARMVPWIGLAVVDGDQH